MQPLFTLYFGEDSGILGAIAYISEDIELNQLHIRHIVEARQMTMDWALAEESDYVKGWEPSKYF